MRRHHAPTDGTVLLHKPHRHYIILISLLSNPIPECSTWNIESDERVRVSPAVIDNGIASTARGQHLYFYPFRGRSINPFAAT